VVLDSSPAVSSVSMSDFKTVALKFKIQSSRFKDC